MINERELLVELARQYPNRTDFKPDEVIEVGKSLGMKASPVYKYITSQPKVKRGVYSLTAQVVPFKQEEVNKPMTSVSSVVNDEVFVPQKEDTYVVWGNFKDVEKIIQSRIFYPTYITGLSGNGKTMMAEQACARANREYVRVQITPETDEDDLIGGFRLVNGETVFAKGPVIKAMERGAILLIDEIDRGSNKIMCLQGVLEGKPVLIKKTGEVVSPSNGFNVIATANTKGKGSDDGRFIAATIIDEAFLERFTITLEQPYPTSSIERKIVMKHMEKYNCVDKEFADLLTVWSETIRKTFEDDGVDEIISTRRLCHIVQSFSIFNDRQKAIELCVNRFDEDTKEAFIDLYTKVDVQPTIEETLGSDVSLDDILSDALKND
jgi:midasin (ATPase involved in ribosome maturation)